MELTIEEETKVYKRNNLSHFTYFSIDGTYPVEQWCWLYNYKQLVRCALQERDLKPAPQMCSWSEVAGQ